MLELEEKIKDEFSGKEEQLSGTVSIGMAEASSANIVADVIEKFRAKFPLVKFDLYTVMADKVPESIDSGTLDIGFLLEPVNVDKYDFISLRAENALSYRMEKVSAVKPRGIAFFGRGCNARGAYRALKNKHFTFISLQIII